MSLPAGLAHVLQTGELNNGAVVGALSSLLRGMHAAGAAPLVLVGYSLGGRLALQVAAAQPGIFSKVAIVSGSAGLTGACESSLRPDGSKYL